MNTYFIESVEYLEDKNVFQKLYQTMPAFRKKKIDSLRSDTDKRLSLGAAVLLGRSLVKSGLLMLTEAEEGSYFLPEMVLSVSGKPFFPDYPDVFFNLSHSGTRVMCAVGTGTVGCDIEIMTRSAAECRALANRFFSPYEAMSLENASENEIVKRFYALWTQKEALAKCFDKPLPEILHDSVESARKNHTLNTETDSMYTWSICY